MKAGSCIAYVFAGMAILFGFLFILGAFSPDGSTGWLIAGVILTIIGFVSIWFAARLGKKAAAGPQVVQQTTFNVDLPGDVDIERFKCADCGAQLSMDDVKMVAGAPMVNCPYCGAAYQLSEAPKW